MEGAIKKYGAYVTRYVEITNPELTEAKAIQVIWENTKFTESVKNDSADSPMS